MPPRKPQASEAFRENKAQVGPAAALFAAIALSGCSAYPGQTNVWALKFGNTVFPILSHRVTMAGCYVGNLPEEMPCTDNPDIVAYTWLRMEYIQGYAKHVSDKIPAGFLALSEIERNNELIKGLAGDPKTKSPGDVERRIVKLSPDQQGKARAYRDWIVNRTGQDPADPAKEAYALLCAWHAGRNPNLLAHTPEETHKNTMFDIATKTRAMKAFYDERLGLSRTGKPGWGIAVINEKTKMEGPWGPDTSRQGSRVPWNTSINGLGLRQNTQQTQPYNYFYNGQPADPRYPTDPRQQSQSLYPWLPPQPR